MPNRRIIDRGDISEFDPPPTSVPSAEGEEAE
jgi:hypothetical protein